MNVQPKDTGKLAGLATARKRSAQFIGGRPPFECIALVLQGGGALGAYQAGVYEALAEAGLEPDWVAGISIGSINAAIIAGNPLKTRVDMLRSFWEEIKAAETAAREIDPEGKRAIGIAMDVSDEEQVDRGTAAVIEAFSRLDILISNAGIQIVAPIVDFEFLKWKKMLAIHLDGAFLTTRAALRQMYRQNGGTIIYMGSVHSKEASPLKAPYVAAKHGLVGLAKVVAKEGAAHGVRSHVICPGFVRTPLVEKQIPEQARELGLSEADVVRNVMLKETVDGEFTTVEDVAEVALFLSAFPSNALTGQSIVVSHGWFMQ